MYEKSAVEAERRGSGRRQEDRIDEETCIGVARQVKQIVDSGCQVRS